MALKPNMILEQVATFHQMTKLGVQDFTLAVSVAA